MQKRKEVNKMEVSCNLNVRVDKNLKAEADDLFKRLGMNMSTAINMFIKVVLREQKLPFEVKSNTLDEVISSKLNEAEIEMNNTSKRYTKDEVFKSMNDILG